LKASSGKILLMELGKVVFFGASTIFVFSLVAASTDLLNSEAASLENLRKLGIATSLYVGDYDDTYPPMSSPANATPRERWPDRLLPYAKDVSIFSPPSVGPEIRNRKFAHDPDLTYGGYGYNYQYLGNSRMAEGPLPLPFGAKQSEILEPKQTILIAETDGVRKDDGTLSGGIYTIDPPLKSARGSGNASGFYASGDSCGSGKDGPGRWGCRSTPVERYSGKVALVFADGSAKLVARTTLDDLNGDGQPDNGYWNGKADASVR
jgi:hypothetical protein